MHPKVLNTAKRIVQRLGDIGNLCEHSYYLGISGTSDFTYTILDPNITTTMLTEIDDQEGSDDLEEYHNLWISMISVRILGSLGQQYLTGSPSKMSHTQVDQIMPASGTTW